MVNFSPWLGNLGDLDGIVLIIAVLLPVTATMTVVQSNPYQALVMRGILGGMAALVYALLGAADVALTEALVGTMLSITLYAVAVRSSLTLRVGIFGSSDPSPTLPDGVEQAILAAIASYHLRLEIVPCPNPGETVAPNHAPQVMYDPVSLRLITPIGRLAEIFTEAIPPSQLTVILAPLEPPTLSQEINP